MHSLSTLLLLAFCLHGVKTPLAFFIWGSLALLVSSKALWKQPESLYFRFHHKEYIFLALVCASLFFSKDRTASLYQSAQIIAFLALWLFCKSDPEIFKNDRLFFTALVILSIMSTAKTIYQMQQGLWGWGHSYGFLPEHPGINATWMACLACVFFAWPHRSRREQVLKHLLGLILTVMVLIGPSRGSLLALGAGVLYILLPSLGARRVFYGVAICFILLSLIPPQLLFRRLRLDEGNYRLKIWGVACQAVTDRPFTGYGLGNFEMAYQRHAFPVETSAVRFARTTEFAHNEFLQVASDLGFPAFLLFVTGILELLFSRRRNESPYRQSAKAGLWTLVISACYFPVWHTPLLLYITLLWCAILSQVPHEEFPIYRVSRAAGSLARASVLILVVSTVFILGWSALREYWAGHQRWDQIVRWNPADSGAWASLAEQQNDTCARGLRYYANAVESSPQQLYFREKYAYRLEACRQDDYLRKSFEQYHAAYALSPYRAVNLLAMGRILYISGSIKASMQWFEGARRLEPQYWECDLWLARCHFRLGDSNKARWILRNLQYRRKQYLTYHEQIRPDLPWTEDSSGYSNTILGYDDRVIEEELRHMLPRRGARSSFPVVLRALPLPLVCKVGLLHGPRPDTGVQ